MYFINSKQINQNIVNRQPVINNMSMSFFRKNNINNQNVKQVQQNTDSENKNTKSMKWGEPIWFLFHTLAEKIKEDSFKNIRVDLLNIIYTICANLPCPTCASHAVEYMNNINYNTIQTKEQLKEMLYTFHNSVNKRKNFALFPRENLQEKYSKANTINIIQNFMIHFSDKHASIHMIANDMHRQRICKKIKDWININIHHFLL
jgi:hypothetical protein